MFGIYGSSTRRLQKADWLARVHQDDIASINGALEAARQRDDIYSARFRTLRPDGSICNIMGVGRKTPEAPTHLVGLNFNLAAATNVALHEGRRRLGALARLKFLTVRSRTANENDASHGAKKFRLITLATRDCERQTLLQRALETMEKRKLRRKFFSPDLLGEPAFDMLLALYVTNASPPTLSLRILSPLLGVPETTAARWLQVLEGEGLALSVAAKSGECGSIHATLTEKGRVALDEYFRATSKN
jgi:hypothetical protein